MAKTAVIYNASGKIVMIVHPDTDSQLDDPAFNPPGCTQVRIDRPIYDQCSSEADLNVVVIPFITDPNLKSAIQGIIAS